MNCPVCGREFSPDGFQIVVPGLGRGFDRVECAIEASVLGLPPAAPPPAPAVVGALAPAAAAAAAPAALGASSAPALVGANLALLAAGTAATIYLWLRVFGADATSVMVPADSAAPPFERSTVAASIDLAPAATRKPAPERTSARPPAAQPATP
ncbi:MAG: hypothetical protein ACRDNI_02360, partial [Gaiellaceae bacterium]